MDSDPTPCCMQWKFACFAVEIFVLSGNW